MRWDNWQFSVLVFIGLFFLNTQTNAQLIKEGSFIEGELILFNEGSIASEGIKSIEIYQLKKPSDQTIVDEGTKMIYSFDSHGRLSTLKYLFQGYKGRTDTIIRSFEYINNQISTQEIIRGKYRKRTDHFYLNDSIKIEKRFVKRGSSDWELIDTEEHRTKHKTLGFLTERTTWIGGIESKPYKRIIETIDQLGRVIKKEIWYGARLNQVESWDYYDKRLATYSRTELREGKTFKVVYPDPSQMEGKGEWCKNETCSTWTLVLNDAGLPKGLIFYQPQTEHIEILNFKYFISN